MDADRRARILAMLDSAPIGVSTLSALVKQLIADLDAMTAERDRWHQEAHAAAGRVADADKAASRAADDARRLARWIIDHPTGDPAQRTELLNLHDRAR